MTCRVFEPHGDLVVFNVNAQLSASGDWFDALCIVHVGLHIVGATHDPDSAAHLGIMSHWVLCVWLMHVYITVCTAYRAPYRKPHTLTRSQMAAPFDLDAALVDAAQAMRTKLEELLAEVFLATSLQGRAIAATIRAALELATADVLRGFVKGTPIYNLLLSGQQLDPAQYRGRVLLHLGHDVEDCDLIQAFFGYNEEAKAAFIADGYRSRVIVMPGEDAEASVPTIYVIMSATV